MALLTEFVFAFATVASGLDTRPRVGVKDGRYGRPRGKRGGCGPSVMSAGLSKRVDGARGASDTARSRRHTEFRPVPGPDPTNGSLLKEGRNHSTQEISY